jgi:hypothetical protein
VGGHGGHPPPGIPAAKLLEAWELGREASPGERGLLLLGVAHPQRTSEALAGWAVGRRDAALLRLRECIFGSRLEALTECPRCGETLEMDFPVSAISAPVATAADEYVLACPGCRVVYRLPTAGDLAELGGRLRQGEQPRSPERWLLQRCVLRVERTEENDAEGRTGGRGAAIGTAEPESRAPSASSGQLRSLEPEVLAPILDQLGGAMTDTVEAVDPQAEVELVCVCPACALQWSAPFDIVDYLWRELEAWVKQLLREVHILASRYGWSERDLLALSPWRRRYYLGLIGG